ncbi:pyridoxamine 5'-phosphate oxidase family protein [Edwardsiella hoshinae]|uniref:UPF0306 protein NCTC12121_03060 n=1 Tax=Edwardsiella hoshinae TaxID=93378 RepID=A0A376DL79_9GAMM|nr:YhbP family protein [Edwardsiella hoshinae]QPR29064.1 pyridoxamine 5'-phosphate oxidase family protein [Edwardsiella hoshinae]STC91499.1 Uncharacterized protein conserved in bacteria [Edwardsiella hoshinae]
MSSSLRDDGAGDESRGGEGLEEDLAVVRRFLARQHVVTLATGQGEALWCASCFYALDAASMTLYLLTSPQSQHGQLMSANPRVAGTVARQTRNVAQIQGIQFTAHIACLAGDDEAWARRCYYRRFPLARLRSAPIWALRLMRVKMTDNRCGFAHKRHWQRQNEEGVY